MRASRWTSAAVCIIITACGGSQSSSTPTGPSSTTPPAPTLTSITINGPDALLTNTAADYTATANFSNQTSQSITATWTGSPSNRAGVSASGRVSGQTHGALTLTASYQGQSATKTVNIVSNYDGRWTGVVIRMKCHLNGALGRRITRRLCPEGPSIRNPMSITISQPAPSFTEVTAALNMYTNTTLNTRGTVANDGRLLLSGDTEYQLPDPVSKRLETVRWSVLKWDTQLTGFTLSLIGGRFDVNRTESLWEGNVYEEYEIEQMRRAPGATGILEAQDEMTPRER